MASRPTRPWATSEPLKQLRELITSGALDVELAALVLLLADRGVPLVVAAADPHPAEAFRGAVSAKVLADHPSRDALPGGVVVGNSLEDVMRVLGGPVRGITGELSDETRDLGVVFIVDVTSTVRVAHYVRPVERDVAGHLQRRPPAVLSSLSATSGRLDHFYWAITDELASRADLTRDDFEAQHAALARQLIGAATSPGPTDARH